MISEVGEGMEQWKVGARVGLSPMMSDGQRSGTTTGMLAADPNSYAMMAVGGAKAGMKVAVIVRG